MTKYLDANYVPWGMEDQFRSTFRDTNPRQEGDVGHFMAPLNNPVGSNLNNITQMPTDGNVVGIIIHVRNNTTPVGSDYRIDFVKGTSDVGTSNPTFTIMDVKAIAPALQTGFFFSDPDIPEFDREFLKGDYIGVMMERNALVNPGNAFGASQVTVFSAIELKTT